MILRSSCSKSRSLLTSIQRHCSSDQAGDKKSKLKEDPAQKPKLEDAQKLKLQEAQSYEKWLANLSSAKNNAVNFKKDTLFKLDTYRATFAKDAWFKFENFREAFGQKIQEPNVEWYAKRIGYVMKKWENFIGEFIVSNAVALF